jgi:hypothetical protein
VRWTRMSLEGGGCGVSLCTDFVQVIGGDD